MAYVSDESGESEVYVQPFPGPGGEWQVSTDGGADPVWNPNGGQLFYLEGNEAMMAVSADGEDGQELRLGKPVRLFEMQTGACGSYDVAPDGQRFAMIDTTPTESAPTQLVLVQNFSEELKRLVPAQ